VALVWISSNQHLLMLVCMLAYVPCRREYYTGGCSLFARVHRPRAQLPWLASHGSQPNTHLKAR
jgi:hypothetical protein